MVKTNLSVLGLLEYLSLKAGCTYLSDLHEPRYWHQLQNTLYKMEHRFYDLREWKDAAHYITGEKSNFENPEQAVQYILGYITGSKEE